MNKKEPEEEPRIKSVNKTPKESKNHPSKKDDKAILNTILETISDSKTHGVSNIIKVENKVLKFIWIVCFITSTFYCAYELVIAILAYLSYGVVLSTSPVYEAPTQFPAVDICNLVPYDSLSASEDINFIFKSNNITNTKFTNAKNYTDTVSDLIKAYYAKLALNGSSHSFKKGYNLEDILISCFYEGTACNISDFFYYSDYNYGNCFSFNLGKTNRAGYNSTQTLHSTLASSFPGVKNGLQLELYVGDAQNQNFSYRNGIKITVHNKSIISFPIEMGLNIPTGFQTDLIVKRTFINHLNAPYSNCLTDPVDYKQNNILQIMMKNYTTATTVYQQSFCLKVCKQRYTISECGCYDLSFPMLNSSNMRGCFEFEEIKCIYKTNLKFINNDQDTYCYSQCPLECNELLFDFQATYSNYPTKWYADMLIVDSNFLQLINRVAPNRTLSYDYLKQNTLLLNVFYDKMQYLSSIESPAITIDMLVAIIGGNMGLFLGISVLSFIELVELVFVTVHCCIKKNENKISIK